MSVDVAVSLSVLSVDWSVCCFVCRSVDFLSVDLSIVLVCVSVDWFVYLFVDLFFD